MHWIGFAIVAFLTAVLQTTVVPHIQLHRIGPDLLLIVAIYYALKAGSDEALLACWILGLVADIIGPHGLGPYAFGYGVMGLCVVWIRPVLFREHPLSQLFLTLVFCWLIQLFVAGYLSVKDRQFSMPVGDCLLVSLYVAMYTAALAPYAHLLLGRGRSLLGLRSLRGR